MREEWREREKEREREVYWSGMAAEHIKAIGSCPSMPYNGELWLSAREEVNR